MVFEPTFDELNRRSAKLESGGDPDADAPETDADIDEAVGGDGDAADLAGAQTDGAMSLGDVEANDLPPYGG